VDIGEVLGRVTVDHCGDLVGEDVLPTIQAPQSGMVHRRSSAKRDVVDELELEGLRSVKEGPARSLFAQDDLQPPRRLS
jgi:hypothetical protein